MIDHDNDVAEAIARVEATSAEAVAVALRHVGRHEPFASAPMDVGDRSLVHFRRIADLRIVEQGEMLKMAEKNLARYVDQLRSRVAIHPQLNAVRVSVLAHVALVIDSGPLLACSSLWSAIARQDWDGAADELWMTKWPEQAQSDGEKRRVLSLTKMMRTGEEDTARVH